MLDAGQGTVGAIADAAARDTDAEASVVDADSAADSGRRKCNAKSGRACTVAAADGGTSSDPDDDAALPTLPPECGGGELVEGDVVVHTAGELEALRGVACVTGNLAITQVAAIADLEPLTSLRWVGGAFEISYCGQLVSLTGLEQLGTVVGALYIDSNSALTDVGALDGLTSAGSLQLYEDTALQQISFAKLTRTDSFALLSSGVVALDGLNQLQQLGLFECRGNSALAHITGFAKLQTITNMEIVNNPVLADIQAFPVLAQVTSALSVVGNPQLTTIAGFGQLHDGGELELGNDDALQVLSGLSHLQHVVGPVMIYGNAALSDLSGFAQLLDVGRSVVIQDNPSLVDVSGFGALTSIGASFGEGLTIRANPALSSIDGFAALQSVGGVLQIQDNGVLASIAGLNSGALHGVGSELSILGNPKLSRCQVDVLRARLLAAPTPFTGIDHSACNEGCTQCAADACTGIVDHTSGQTLVYTGDADIDNPGLTNAVELTGSLTAQGAAAMADLSRLQQVDGSVTISGTTLQSLAGLASLREIGGGLNIYQNAALQSLDGLSSLERVHDISLSANPMLSSIDGLASGALTDVAGQLRISLNPSLSRCRVDALVAMLVAAQPGLAGANLSSANRGCTTCSAQDCTAGDGTTDGQSGILTGDIAVSSDAAVYRYVTDITGSLSVYGNPSVTNLDALANLDTVAGSIMIKNNPALTSIAGIVAGAGGALTQVGGTVTVTNNASLTECAAAALVSALQSNGYTQTVAADHNATCSTTCAGPLCL